MFNIPLPLIIVPIVVFVFIVYFAISKKSSLFIRWTAIIALIIIGVAVIVCVCVIFGEPTDIAVKGRDIKIISEEKPVPVKEVDPIPLLLFSLLLLLFIAVIVYAAFHEQRRKKKKSSQPPEMIQDVNPKGIKTKDRKEPREGA